MGVWKRRRKLWQKFRFLLLQDGYARADYLRKHEVLKGIGENVYFYSRIFPADPKLVMLHNNISIATNVRFITHDRIDIVLSGMYPDTKFRKRYESIEVMDNVFIGADVIILPGVRIGPNAIVGAGAVVTKDVPEGSIAGGNPAVVIGEFDQLVEKRLKHPRPSGKEEKVWKKFDKKHKKKSGKKKGKKKQKKQKKEGSEDVSGS